MNFSGPVSLWNIVSSTPASIIHNELIGIQYKNQINILATK